MKYILKMAFRNVGRNKRRTMLSAVAISIAVMVVLVMRGYMGGITDSMVDSLAKTETGHIKIAHSEYYERQDMMPLEHAVDGFNGEGYKPLVSLLESVDGVKIVAPRIKFGVLLNFDGKSRSALGMGIDANSEKMVASLDRMMVEGQYFGDDENSKSVILGSALAGKLGIKLNDKLTILARTAYDSLRGMTFRVTGIFSHGMSSLDSKLFYIPIGAAARLLEMGNGASELILMTDNIEYAQEVADEIRSRFTGQGSYLEDGKTPLYAVVPWQEQETFYSMFRSATRMYDFVFVGLLILASTVIINTTMMVIYERVREIGTIGALGMTGRQIVLLFVVEAMIISAIGSFLGMAAGGGIDLFLSIKGIDLQALSGGSTDMPTTDIIYPHFGASLLVGSFLFGVAVASVIAFIPSLRAARIQPVEALRSI